MTPEDVLSHPARVLTQKQREFYVENGYVTVEGAISPEWLDRLRAVNAEMIEKGRAVERSNDVYILEDGHSFETPRLRRITNPVTHHPVYWEFASESASADVAADVVGPDVKFYHSKLNFKWAKGGQDFKWHQDVQAWPHTNYSPVTIGLYIDDCDMEQGPLIVARGSHNGPLHSMYDAHGNWVLNIPKEKLPSEETWDYLTGPAGTLVLLNCRTVHGSLRNESPRSRPFLLNVYSSADAFPYRPNPLPNPYEGAIVRGQPARWAHHDPRPCEIPPDWSSGYSGPWAHQKGAASGAAAAKGDDY